MSKKSTPSSSIALVRNLSRNYLNGRTLPQAKLPAKTSPANSTPNSTAKLPASSITLQTLRVMAESYRAVAGLTASQCPDAEAIDRLLNPARNLYRLETLNVGVHAPAMRALQHANYTFA